MGCDDLYVTRLRSHGIPGQHATVEQRFHLGQMLVVMIEAPQVEGST